MIFTYNVYIQDRDFIKLRKRKVFLAGSWSQSIDTGKKCF